VQHLREAGQLQGAVQDIGPLIQEIPRDVEKECKPEIMEALWKWAWPHIKRAVTRGFPEWYKEKLLEKAFESADNNLAFDVGRDPGDENDAVH
jgi:hypothetical protein